MLTQIVSTENTLENLFSASKAVPVVLLWNVDIPFVGAKLNIVFYISGKQKMAKLSVEHAFFKSFTRK